jgi:hypothetical protein
MEMNGLVTAAIASPLPVRSGMFCTCTKSQSTPLCVTTSRDTILRPTVMLLLYWTSDTDPVAHSKEMLF